MYKDGCALVSIETLLQLLSAVPQESMLWVNPTGNLSIVQHGRWLGIVDINDECVRWKESESSDDPMSHFG